MNTFLAGVGDACLRFSMSRRSASCRDEVTGPVQTIGTTGAASPPSIALLEVLLVVLGEAGDLGGERRQRSRPGRGSNPLSRSFT